MSKLDDIEEKCKYKDEPVLFSKMFQAQKGYIGVDNLKETTLKKGDLIVALEIPNGGSSYFITLEQFEEKNLDAIALCQAAQVSAWYKAEVTGKMAQYKPTARIYYVNDNIKAAIGNTTENPQYGSGGVTQIVIPHGIEITRDAYKDLNHSRQHVLIPVNLNDYKSDSRILLETFKRIDEISSKFNDSINFKDGYFLLKNKDITKAVYSLILQRTEVHQQTIIYNCLLKEYTDELENPKKDLDYINELKVKLSKSIYKLMDVKVAVQEQIAYLKNNNDLLQGISKENQKHLLDINTCCPQNIIEQTKYLENKVETHENKLSVEEKIKLSIDTACKEDKNIIFEKNSHVEDRIKETYRDITRESDLEVKGLDNRELVHTPNPDPFKKELLCQLKAKDELKSVLAWNEDKNINKFCNEQMKEVDIRIGQLEEYIKQRGKTDRTTFDDKIDYIKQKVLDPKRYLPENHFQNESYKEGQIEKLTSNALRSVDSNNSILLKNINELYKLNVNLVETQTELNKMHLFKEEMIKLENEKKDLEDIKNKLKIVDKYNPIAEKYSNNKNGSKSCKKAMRQN